MTDTALLTDEIAQQRPCTRCDGEQHLLASQFGMGKYRCDRCGMVVGFDVEQEPNEFLIDRGAPSRYTRQVFGDKLNPTELRLRVDA